MMQDSLVGYKAWKKGFASYFFYNWKTPGCKCPANPKGQKKPVKTPGKDLNLGAYSGRL